MFFNRRLIIILVIRDDITDAAKINKRNNLNKTLKKKIEDPHNLFCIKLKRMTDSKQYLFDKIAMSTPLECNVTWLVSRKQAKIA